ncbi:unnamed protein product [Urochloa decumbens]|uniref:Protein kinase domain-containing protein n=1 Tax=Urochloa decumbens TaxID=240449 RepID=A0ABC9GTQ2_9POAL
MGWTSAFFGRLMKSDSSSTSATPLFAVDSTELVLTVDVPELRARELNKATRSFSSARLIGEGSSIHNHGTVVYRATLPDGTAAAAKVLGRPPSSGRWGASEDAFLRQQVSLLSTLRHDNLVRLLGYTIAPDLHVLLYEFATVSTLHDVLHGPRGEPQPQPQPGSGSRPAVTLSWEQRTRIALDAARGLQYLHEAAAVTHWGINSTNVLLFQGLRAKIADYDVFEQGDGDMRACNRRATPINVACVPPEYVTRGSRVARKADVYGFGVVLLELLTGRKSFDATLGPSHSMLVHWAIPLLRQGGIEQWIDPKLGTQYPPAEALKLARIAQQCLHDHARSRPSIGVIAQMISDIVRD